MRKFMVIWAGQTASRFGSYMTAYALDEFWVWEQTGRASTSAMISVMAMIGAVLALFFGGALVDRYSRKRVMMIADSIGALGTLAYLLLHLSGNLQVWHLYIGAGFIFFFGELHGLAFLSATTMLVPRHQYARAGSLRFLTHYGALILAPPLAAVLYGSVGLGAIMVIDLITVVIAVGSVALLQIPNPPISAAGRDSRTNRWRELLYGFRYIWRVPSLRVMVLILGLFTFVHEGGESIYSALVLSRTRNDFSALGIVGTAAGVGGLIGAIAMTVWGGPRRKIRGWLGGTVSAGLAKLGFSLGRGLGIWFPAQLWSSVNFPIRGGCKEAILLNKIEPDVQGRYFGAEQIIVSCTSALARLSIAPLADTVIEPAMRPGGVLANLFGGIFGVGAGAGYSLTYFCTSSCVILIGVIGFMLPALRQIEARVPDYEILEKEPVIQQAA